MFFRRKLSGKTEYLQIVKNERVDGKPRQSVVATLGRVDDLVASGEIDRLLRSGARFAATAVVLTVSSSACGARVSIGEMISDPGMPVSEAGAESKPLPTADGGSADGGSAGSESDAATYEPCAGKTCGARCTSCPPGDASCFEPVLVKFCDSRGECIAGAVTCGPNDDGGP